MPMILREALQALYDVCVEQALDCHAMDDAREVLLATQEWQKIVQREPTQEMLDAAQAQDLEGQDDPIECYRQIWLTMYDAAEQRNAKADTNRMIEALQYIYSYADEMAINLQQLYPDLKKGIVSSVKHLARIAEGAMKYDHKE